MSMNARVGFESLLAGKNVCGQATAAITIT